MTGEVLVTGAAGFVGGHLARACLAAGWSVTALDLRRTPPGPARSVCAPADDDATVRDVRAGRYVAVLHQAAVSDTLEPEGERLQRSNVQQPLVLAEACATSGTPFVYASSHSVYGRIHGRVAVAEGAESDPAVCSGPLNAYARSKLTLDRAMSDRYGTTTAWAGLRYTNVFGTGEEHKGRMASILSQLLRGAAAGRPLRLFADTLEASRDYVPVEAVADVVVGSVGRLADGRMPSGVYNLGSGCPVSFAAVLRWCAELADTGPVAVELVANPVPDRYQYWTCADQRRLRAVLPDRGVLDGDGVRRAARRLFDQLRDGAPPSPRTMAEEVS